MKFDSHFTFKIHVRGIVSRVSQRIGILRLVKLVFVDNFICYFANCSLILEYCSPVWWSAAECHLQLLARQVYLVARYNQSFLSLCHRRHVAGLCMLHKVNSNSNRCLFCELPSASSIVRYTRATAADHLNLSLKYQGVELPNLQGVSCRPKFEYGIVPTLFYTGTLDVFFYKG